MPENNLKVCIIVPMFNEASIAASSLAEILSYVRDLPGQRTILVVEDGSSDQTQEIVQGSIAADPDGIISLVVHEQNRGYGAALVTGMQFAIQHGYDYALFMDSDLTNHPRYLKNFWEKMSEGHDYIKATRYSGGGTVQGVPWQRRIISWIGNRIARPAFDMPIRDYTNGFRAVKVNILAQMKLVERGFSIILEELCYAKQCAQTFVEIPYVLTSRNAEQRASSFSYDFKTYATYLRYVLKAWRTQKVLPSSRCIACGQSLVPWFRRETFRYLRCRSCGHVVTLPYPSDEEIMQHYTPGKGGRNYHTMNVYAETYRAAMADLFFMLRRALHSMGKNVSALRLLDVGCFSGVFLKVAQEQGMNVAGLELQSEAVALARVAVGDSVVVQGSVHDPDVRLPHDSYDVVSALGLVEHVTDPIALFAQLHALLPPGGVLMVQTPNAGSRVARVLKKWWPPFTPVEHIHLFSKKSLCLALRQNGFAVRSVHAHVKRLSVAYVYEMLSTFAPRLHTFFAPVYRHMPERIRRMVLPWYVGEMVVMAERV